MYKCTTSTTSPLSLFKTPPMNVQLLSYDVAMFHTMLIPLIAVKDDGPYLSVSPILSPSLPLAATFRRYFVNKNLECGQVLLWSVPAPLRNVNSVQVFDRSKQYR